MEAVEKEILNAGLPLPAEVDAETTPVEIETGGTDGPTPESDTNNLF